LDVQEIHVFIEKNGEVRLEVRGVKGESCLDLTQALEAALGGDVIAREMTAEAAEQVREEDRLRQWSG
jgi:hypothetical protein